MIVYLRLRCLHSVLFRHARSFICEHGFREISGTSQVHGTEKRIRSSKVDLKTKSLKRKRENKDEFPLSHISETTRVLYYALRLNKVFGQQKPAGAESFERRDKSCEFKNALKILKSVAYSSALSDTFLKLKRDFQANCERMSNEELVALVYHLSYKLVEDKPGNRPVDQIWSEQTKKLFNLLERELFQRLNSCFQYEHNPEDFSDFESALHILLRRKVGFRLFQTYVRYCTYRSDSAVTLDNMPLLLLSICRVRFESQNAFAFLEDFTSKHFIYLDFPVISLFCLTFFICNMPIASDQLLNQIGTRLLQHLRESRASDIRVHDIVNILKTLRHSGYAKASFYSELEHLLIAGNFINNCNMTQAMQILRTFETFKICPSELLESLTKRVKLLLKKDETSFRIKDIGSYVNMLGIYQYKDAEENDVFSVCADVVLQQLQTGIRMEPLRYTAMYLSSCATGLLYAGKFNEDIVDALFGIPNVVDYLEETKLTELLILHNSMRLEYPQYKGRKISQADADRIQSKLNENWNIAMELDLSSDLKEQVDILRSLVGGDRIEVGYILPYLRTADVTVFLDDDDRLVRPQLAKKKVAVEVVGWGQCVRGTDKMLGKYILKLRHLEKLGYKIITVGPQERYHVRLYGSVRDKKDFWIKKLQDSGINISRDRETVAGTGL